MVNLQAPSSPPQHANDNRDTINDLPQLVLNLEDPDMHVDENGDPMENPLNLF